MFFALCSLFWLLIVFEFISKLNAYSNYVNNMPVNIAYNVTHEGCPCITILFHCSQVISEVMTTMFPSHHTQDLTKKLSFAIHKPCGKAAGSKFTIGGIAPFISPLIIKVDRNTVESPYSLTAKSSKGSKMRV